MMYILGFFVFIFLVITVISLCVSILEDDDV